MTNNIEPLIKVIIEQQVMLDKDLATLYGVETKVLNQTVKRNIERFPNDFRFELSKEECLRSQIVTLNGRGGSRYSTTVLTLLEKRNLEVTLLQSESRFFFFISMISLLFPSYSIKNTKKLWWFQLFSVSLQKL